MLEEGAAGESKTQISNVIGEYEAKKYINSKNMSFANSIFIKDIYQNSIKTDYINTLMEKYNAEVKIDSFTTPNNVNSWVNDKTLGLINNLFNDISSNNFLLILASEGRNLLDPPLRNFFEFSCSIKYTLNFLCFKIIQ